MLHLHYRESSVYDMSKAQRYSRSLAVDITIARGKVRADGAETPPWLLTTRVAPTDADRRTR